MLNDYAGANVRAQQATLTGQVFGLLGFSVLFTMGGAVLSQYLGPGAFWLSLVGSFGSIKDENGFAKVEVNLPVAIL